jgi:putative transposase
MNRKLSLVEQIAELLKQAEPGLPLADSIRKTRMSEQSFGLWKTEHAGSESDQIREFRQLLEENARLKVDLSLGNAVLQEFVSKEIPGSRE